MSPVFTASTLSQEGPTDYAQIDSTYYCGINLHARSMYACILDRTGNVLFHRELRNDFGR